MNKSGGFIALLLIIAILCRPFGNSHEHSLTESPPFRGVSVIQSETAPQADGEDDTSQIIAVVVFVIIVVLIIYCITGSDNPSHERR